MPNFRYRALSQTGEVVSGSISAPTATEVAHRIEYLGLLPIDTVAQEGTASPSHFGPFNRPRPEDVTAFTRELALLLKSGVRINDGLELLADDNEIGRLRPVIVAIRAAVLSGESFAEAASRYPALFPSVYLALLRVGEASGKLDHILDVLAEERTRAEALRQQLLEALRYPAFVLVAAACVLIFFLWFVLPQFATVLKDFNIELNPVLAAVVDLSENLQRNTDSIMVGISTVSAGVWLWLRRSERRVRVLRHISHLPLIRRLLAFHHSALFCRNLSVLLASGVALTSALRILSDIMTATGSVSGWRSTVDRVRHGSKLSDALAEAAAIPALAIRMLRLGEETGQLPVMAGKVADLYEVKLQRNLQRMMGIVGPLAIVIISIVVGGLIVSVMTALLSVSQIVG
jgi:general secretion pathway protein F